MMVLFLGICFGHSFVGIFFVIYLMIRTIVQRSKYYLLLFVSTLSTYLTVQLSMAGVTFIDSIQRTIASTSEYSSFATNTLAAPTVWADTIAQIFSRLSVVSFVLISGIGFILILVRRKSRPIDRINSNYGVTVCRYRCCLIYAWNTCSTFTVSSNMLRSSLPIGRQVAAGI